MTAMAPRDAIASLVASLKEFGYITCTLQDWKLSNHRISEEAGGEKSLAVGKIHLKRDLVGTAIDALFPLDATY